MSDIRWHFEHYQTDIDRYLPYIAIGAFVIAAITILPSFAPAYGTAAANVAAKADKLQVAAVTPQCAEQNWPNIDVSCLKTTGAKHSVGAVRLVTTDRR